MKEWTIALTTGDVLQIRVDTADITGVGEYLELRRERGRDDEVVAAIPTKRLVYFCLGSSLHLPGGTEVTRHD